MGKKKTKGIPVIIVAGILLAGGYMNLDDFFGIVDQKDASIEETIAEGEIKVTFLDVGQGDCTVIETEDGCMVIDAGNNNKGEVVGDFLKENGIEKLDYFILSHPDADHIGGADDVIEGVEVESVIMPDVANDTRTYEEVIGDIELFNVEVIYPQVGEVYSIGDAEFTILCPENGLVKESDLNGSSVGIKLVHGENSFVLCADAEETSELSMVEHFGKNLECDVLKCGHHGSSTATTKEFLEMTNPTWAVISCGEDNSYGHPHAEVVSRLEDDDVQILRTDTMGTVEAVSDGQNIYWTTER